MVVIELSSQKDFEKTIANGVTLVDFNAPWCASCRAQNPVLKQLAEAYNDQAAVVKVNINEVREIALNLQIQSIPTLEDMMVKYEGVHEEYGTVMAIDDYINLAREGNEVSIEVSLEYVPAVEHFASHKNAQIFLMVDFTVMSLGKTSYIERCLACYPKEREEEKQGKVDMANDRLKLLYEDFERASIIYEKSFFK